MENNNFREKFQKRIHTFIINLVNFLDSLPKNDSLSLVIKNQLIRSGTSVGANYVEAGAASSRKDFINFLHHSLKSANESGFWLTLLSDSKRGDAGKVSILLRELDELSKILGSSIITLKNKK
ncbi:MAG: CHP02436-containing protein [Parcubacteria group bacterium GW2011_GWA1_48_11b]|uniref:Four helix bundle protein n=1 Tax=Candidatus Harrisonbacteria bacterium RIFCSPHIGHO2_12_FULL_48_16 TaxID=1798405 RepID=A0A1G1ZKQ6_9BACT|nr:MAG: CHP02436-containing protein [Parcubacteria group bacterium GW2011_GWA1_48_11b]OGY65085.1 MAG: hypothetical protein A3E64_00340 [Candidatus Harrisonbacteria bacterium RIFCSPHIGHO2_12_FULL_48_16]